MAARSGRSLELVVSDSRNVRLPSLMSITHGRVMPAVMSCSSTRCKRPCDSEPKYLAKRLHGAVDESVNESALGASAAAGCGAEVRGSAHCSSGVPCTDS